MTDSTSTMRQQLSEHLRSAGGLLSQRLVDAFATVPRERFLPQGPWLVRGERDRDARPTPDADPRHLYEDVSVAIRADRQLYNGAPGAIAPWIEALDLAPGRRVLQVGCGLGYYTAILAECVGPTGRVVAVEVDDVLARHAREALTGYDAVDVRVDDGRRLEGERFDAILVHAGVTHPEPGWLDALDAGGRLVLPLTCAFPGLAPLGKGYAVRLTATNSALTYDARLLGMVMIYSAVGLRDPVLNAALGQAFMKGPPTSLARLRRDPHDSSSDCWFHHDWFCLSRT